MNQSNRVNVLLVANVSAGLIGALATIFMPFFSTLLLFFSAPAAHSAAIEIGMVAAVITPFVGIGGGFVFGALMALAYNMFGWALIPSRRPLEVVVKKEVAQVALRDVA